MNRFLPAAGLAALALSLTAGPSLAASPEASKPINARPQKVVVIGIDGALYDKIVAADAPNLHGLIASGYASKSWLYAEPMAPTVSGAGWGTVVTGVWPDKHKIRSNSWGGTNDLARYPDFLTRLKQARPELATYAIATWHPVVDDSAGKALFGPAVDRRVAGANDADTAAQAAAYLRDTGPDASFVHLDEVDGAGHSCGSEGACYLPAIEKADGEVGQILAGLRARPTYADEDWTVIVTADHGHTPTGGHGGDSPLERSTFVIKAGPGTAPEKPAIAPKIVDIAPTVLNTFGVAADPGWGLDGQLIGAPTGDPFDGLAGSLRPRVDETGIGADVLGWTQQTPAGWTIDNTGLATGGMTEWRGWSFSTDEFWTKTERGQQRETNVRARGVFAVADSDEFADKAYTGTFNSRLVSPPYDVTGAGLVRIGFSSHYRKEGAETAKVSVSFDGGGSRDVLTYTGDAIAKRELLEVPVPAGARHVVVTWSLTGGDNNWYWAVDAPTVTKAPFPVVSGSSYQVASSTGQAIDLPASRRGLQQLRQLPVSDSTGQRWTFFGRPGGTYQLRNVKSGWCMDLGIATGGSGTPVVQARCGSRRTQRWTVGVPGGGRYSLVAAAGGQVVTIAGSAAGDGVIQAVDAGTPAQRWTFVKR